ncbi:hypothetical protein DFQ30_002303, partial [Apophysomyces sp. BC1015]
MSPVRDGPEMKLTVRGNSPRSARISVKASSRPATMREAGTIAICVSGSRPADTNSFSPDSNANVPVSAIAQKQPRGPCDRGRGKPLLMQIGGNGGRYLRLRIDARNAGSHPARLHSEQLDEILRQIGPWPGRVSCQIVGQRIALARCGLRRPPLCGTDASDD